MKTRITTLIFLMVLGWAATGWTQTGEEALAQEYFRDGEFDSALPLYEKLYKKDAENPEIIQNIAYCYQQLSRYEEGIKFLDKVLRRQPSEFQYEFLKADLLRFVEKYKDADDLEKNVIYKRLKTDRDFVLVGSFLAKNDKPDLALATYLQGRKELKSKFLFGSEVAELYANTGKYGEATEEYINLYRSNPSYRDNVTTSILNLVSQSSKDEVERVLLEKVSKYQNDIGLRNMTFQFYVLTEEFYEAFIQVKSIDKFFRENGERVFRYAMTLRNNKNYRLSNKALDYIIENKNKESAWYYKAYQEKTINSELIAFEAIPLDTAAIREAVEAYDGLLSNFGRNARFFDAMYRKANLCAFYLAQLDVAIEEMDNALELSIQAPDRAKANLLVGDVLLMQKDYAKARLRYEEVVEAFKEGQIGAMAKYRQGRLSYYKGDFEYSKARLKSIKDNTSNDISNDAIKLFLLIQDNSGMDTTTTALEMFAQSQLLVYQREYARAMDVMDSVLFNFPNHSLTDEILWEKANIYIAENNMDKGLIFLEKIIEGYPEDILGDDALFTKAKIYDYNLKNKQTAMNLYIDFLKTYSGSLYIVEVRKRIRELRKEI